MGASSCPSPARSGVRVVTLYLMRSAPRALCRVVQGSLARPLSDRCFLSVQARHHCTAAVPDLLLSALLRGPAVPVDVNRAASMQVPSRVYKQDVGTRPVLHL